MPLDDPYVVQLARTVRDVYEQAELDLVAVVAQQVARNTRTDQPPGARAEADAVARVAAGARKITARLDRLGVNATVGALTKAQDAGIRKAERELKALLGHVANDYRRGANTAALAAWSRGLVDTQREAHRAILRTSTDAYRDVMARVYGPRITGAVAKRTAIAQQVMDEFAARGITGFTDKAGRRWRLSTYVEMATRTAAQRALVEGQIDRLETQGIDLLIVSDSPRECALCRPWEGKVLTRTGVARTEARRSMTGPGTVDVTIDGSLAEAMAAGLFHPNCTHAIAGYIPGATRRPENTEDPDGYADRQALRALERGKRAAAERKAAALDKPARRAAAADVAAWDQAIADHVALTGLIRQPDRERIDLGLKVGRADPHRVDELLAERDAAERAAAKSRAAVRKRQETAARRAAEREAAEQAERDRLEAERLEAERVALEEAARPALPDPDTDTPVDPGGPVRDLTDDELEAALGASLTAEDYDRFEDLSNESDRRDAARDKRAARREKDAARRAAKRAERDAARAEAERVVWERAEALMDQGMDGQAAEAEARGVDYWDIVKRDALAELNAGGYSGGWERATRDAFELELQLEVIRAEDATRGALLNRRARARNVDPKRLFYGTEAFARANAAEELLAYWDETGGRLTLEHFRDRLLYGAHEANRRHGGREDYHQ